MFDGRNCLLVLTFILVASFRKGCDETIARKFASNNYKIIHKASMSLDICKEIEFCQFTLSRLALKFYVLSDKWNFENLCHQGVRMCYAAEKEMRNGATLMLTSAKSTLSIDDLVNVQMWILDQIPLDFFEPGIYCCRMIEHLQSIANKSLSKQSTLLKAIEQIKTRAVGSPAMVAAIRCLTADLGEVVSPEEGAFELFVILSDIFVTIWPSVSALKMNDFISKKIGPLLSDLRVLAVQETTLRQHERADFLRTALRICFDSQKSLDGYRRTMVHIFNHGCQRFDEKNYDESSFLFGQSLETFFDMLSILGRDSPGFDDLMQMCLKTFDSLYASCSSNEDTASMLPYCRKLLDFLVNVDPNLCSSYSREIVQQYVQLRVRHDEQPLCSNTANIVPTISNASLQNLAILEAEAIVCMDSRALTNASSIQPILDNLALLEEQAEEMAKILRLQGKTEDALMALERIANTATSPSCLLDMGIVYCHMGILNYELGRQSKELLMEAFMIWSKFEFEQLSGQTSVQLISARDSYNEIDSLGQSLDLFRLHAACISAIGPKQKLYLAEKFLSAGSISEATECLNVAQRFATTDKVSLDGDDKLYIQAITNHITVIGGSPKVREIAEPPPPPSDENLVAYCLYVKALELLKKSLLFDCYVEAESAVNTLFSTVEKGRTFKRANSWSGAGQKYLDGNKLTQDLLLLLIGVSLKLGLAYETEHFISRSLSLAEKTKCQTLRSLIFTIRAQFELRKGRREESEKALKEVDLPKQVLLEDSGFVLADMVLVGEFAMSESSQLRKNRINHLFLYPEIEPLLSDKGNALYLETIGRLLAPLNAATSKTQDYVFDWLFGVSLRERKNKALLLLNRLPNVMAPPNPLKEQVEAAELEALKARLWFRKAKGLVSDTMIGAFIPTVVLVSDNFASKPKGTSISKSTKDLFASLQLKISQAFEIICSYGTRSAAEEVGLHLSYLHMASQAVFRLNPIASGQISVGDLCVSLIEPKVYV
ncbi:hypothetical protein HDU97_010068 [Phlyctochytrium planicorne]|nr:hypothetical protein HDU97_010068 [Phlyctochytrium planicorne]